MKRSMVWLLILTAAAVPASATETTFWQVGTYEEFLQGTLRDLSLTREGQLLLGPEAKSIFNPEEALALSLASDKDRNIYIGTGHQGKVFKVDAKGKGSLLFAAREPEIFALAAAPDGSLYVGSSPEGKIYRVSPDGKSAVFYEPKVKYIWALALDQQGNLFAATGDQGKILKIDSAGKGMVFLDSKQTHIMCLTFDREGNLLAGSVPNGQIYRINPQGKAFVLYQANFPEIHDLSLDTEGRIYAAALGGAGGKATPDLFPGATQAPAQGSIATITVTASTETPSKDAKEAQTLAPNQGGATTARPGPQTPAFPVPQMPQGRGSLILVRPDQTVETVWSSNSESIFGLAVEGDRVFFSSDSNGRVFELVPTAAGQKVTLMTQTRESLASRLLIQGSDLYVATSNIAKLFKVSGALGKEGTYESTVRDTKFISKWGNLVWRADIPAGSSVEFFSRSGNSDRPDETWSDWAGPYRTAEASAIQSPAARYFQWKAALKATGDKGPILNEVTISYLNQNLPPQIRSLSVSSAGERTSPTGAVSSPASGAGSTLSTSASSGGTSASGGIPKTPTTVTWQAEDPNGDQLVYSVYVKATDEQEWHLLKDKLHQTTFTVEANTLADGKYVGRVVASDQESNPSDTARSAELVSGPFWVDNTPPVVSVLHTQNSPGSAQVQFHVQDTTSPLRAAETSVDGKDWHDAPSDDGIVDTRQENFTVKLGRLEPGEHIVVLRAFDVAGNAGIGKAVVLVSAGSEGSH